MIEFSKQISEKWNISQALSELICIAYEKNDTPYYLVEYCPEVSVELSISSLWEIYDFLKTMEELASKKKRVINALKKAEKASPAAEKRVALTTSSFELDDMLIPFRPNPRSKGQLASKKGLDSLADLILRQKEETTPVEQLAEQYVNKDPSLKTPDDVIQGVKDILAEKFAYDETVRAMAREFAYDDGFFEVTPKNRKDPKFSQYIGKLVQLSELTKEEILNFLVAEDSKQIRLKLGVQLFRITELIRHHFITNPDSVGFDLICEAIDDSWIRLLQPAIERDVKVRLKEESEQWALKKITIELEKSYKEELNRGALLIADASYDKQVYLLTVSGKGELLGTTTERKPQEGKSFSTDRLHQFLIRHKPSSIIIVDNSQSQIAETILTQALSKSEMSPSIVRYSFDDNQKNTSDSEWIKQKFGSLLDDGMRKLYGYAIEYLHPISLVLDIGLNSYRLHPLQNLVSEQIMSETITRIITYAALIKGVLLKDIADSYIKQLSPVNAEMLQSIKNADSQGNISEKNDLLKVPSITEVAFRNIAGFIVVLSGENILDRTLVHPDHFPWISEISEQLNVSIDTIVNDPEIVNSYSTDDPVRKIYLEKKLIDQLAAGKLFAGQAPVKVKRKLKLTELKEGAIVSGRVTNITQFGVFVNINAVCDGLIHISQLADDYVESPEQVVSVNDKVDVRILKVDVKKRRISLSMKNLGSKAPKVKPSKGQLDNLAEHFKNR
jgi:uncharacterized protein